MLGGRWGVYVYNVIGIHYSHYFIFEGRSTSGSSSGLDEIVFLLELFLVFSKTILNYGRNLYYYFEDVVFVIKYFLHKIQVLLYYYTRMYKRL